MWRFFLLALLLIWTASPAVAEETLPIWLNEEFFGIAQIEDYEARLYERYRPFNLNMEGRPRRTLRNCTDFLAANAEGAELRARGSFRGIPAGPLSQQLRHHDQLSVSGL